MSCAVSLLRCYAVCYALSQAATHRHGNFAVAMPRYIAVQATVPAVQYACQHCQRHAHYKTQLFPNSGCAALQLCTACVHPQVFMVLTTPTGSGAVVLPMPCDARAAIRGPTSEYDGQLCSSHGVFSQNVWLGAQRGSIPLFCAVAGHRASVE